MYKITLLLCILVFSTSFAQESNVLLDKKNTDKQSLHTLSKVAAYPNPFSSRTNIVFYSSKNQFVEINVKNLLGKSVYYVGITADKNKNIIPFNGTNLDRGVYIYSIKTAHELISKRMLIK